jgi:hypothetical protein
MGVVVRRGNSRALPQTTLISHNQTMSNDKGTTPKCRQCNKTAVTLFRDDADGKLYCGPCWKKFYKKFAPESAKFTGAQKKHQIERLPAEPVCGETAELDTYFVGIDDEAPTVYSDSGVAWSVMLKNTSKGNMAMAMLQLIRTQDAHVVFCRTGKIGSEQDISTQPFADLGEAKLLFASLFEGHTGNAWVAIMLDIHNFVPKADRFTLLGDPKAARRAQNDANRKTKEDAKGAEDDKRNEAIAAGTRKLLEMDAAKEAGSGGAAAAPAEMSADSSVNGGDEAAKTSPKETKAAPKEAKAAPAPAPAKEEAKTAPAARAMPPPSPKPKPQPRPDTAAAKPAATTTANAKPANATAAAPSVAATPAPKIVVEEAPKSGGLPLLPIVAVGVAAVGIAAFMLTRSSKK